MIQSANRKKIEAVRSTHEENIQLLNGGNKNDRNETIRQQSCDKES